MVNTGPKHKPRLQRNVLTFLRCRLLKRMPPHVPPQRPTLLSALRVQARTEHKGWAIPSAMALPSFRPFYSDLQKALA